MNASSKIIQCIIGLLVSVSLYSCGGCKDEPPRAQILNNGTVEVSAQIKTSGGNTENINNITPGTASSFKSYSPGEVTFTITPKNGTDLVKKVVVENCMDYSIVLNQDNQIIVTPTERD